MQFISYNWKNGRDGMDIRFEEAAEEDIPELTMIMKRSFDEDSRIHLGEPEGGPPGYDNGDFFRKWMLSYEESHGYKIIVEDKIIGFFLVWLYEHGDNALGNIFVDPDYQNRGIGSKTMQHIFNKYAAKSWTLDTPIWATRNHHFYGKHGFKKVGEGAIPGDPTKLVILKKDMA
ncbi:MAG: GNAT family N-acetyltransferase [Candidatus Odinarchaeota archaeon]